MNNETPEEDAKYANASAVEENTCTLYSGERFFLFFFPDAGADVDF